MPLKWDTTRAETNPDHGLSISHKSHLPIARNLMDESFKWP
jgi:hypothetical protein